MKKSIIIGEHIICDSIISQYEMLGYEVAHFNEWDDTLTADSADQMCVLLDNKNRTRQETDRMSINIMEAVAKNRKESDRLLTCHLLVHSVDMLKLLHSEDFCTDIRNKIDIYPFNINELWRHAIRLDWKPITMQDEHTAHLLVLGNNDLTELVAMNVAYNSHFPNYVRNHSLRTRITIVDDHAKDLMLEWTYKYKPLFDNSYYRLICPEEKKMQTFFHEPLYKQSREDFVDVEWEFVCANIYNPVVRAKMLQWTKNTEQQLLTVVFANDNQAKNINDALNLPDLLFHFDIPVYCYVKDDTFLTFIEKSARMKKIRFFGMENSGYDVRMPYVQMAKTVNYVYSQCYSDNFEKNPKEMQYTVEIDKEECEKQWKKLSNVKRQSCIRNAMNIPVKMRSVGLNENEWEKAYDLPEPTINFMAQVEHNRWCVEELILGWKPCDDRQQEMVEKNLLMKDLFKKKEKVHYDLRAYNDLRNDITGKNVKIYDICLCAAIPIIAKAVADQLNIKDL